MATRDEQNQFDKEAREAQRQNAERLRRKKMNPDGTLKSKAHPPGKPGKPNPTPSSPYEPGKSPFKLAKKKSKYNGKGPAPA